MTETTRQVESSAARTMYVAFELGDRNWKLAVTTDRRERPRHYVVDAGDMVAVLEKLARARQHWGLRGGTRVRSARALQRA